MITASCHCGRVTLEIETAPLELNDCQCSICRRYGVLWAYYAPKQVRISGETETYIWGERSLAFHRCGHCGCVSHWAATDTAYERMGVNARLMPPEVVSQARVRRSEGPR
jgi:hypothetical protein